MRYAIAFTACLAMVTTTSAAEPQREAFDDAIDKGLEYLSRSQSNNGSWSTRRKGQDDPAVTSLCVMAFMSAGHVPGEGKYGAHVDKGIRYVLDQQQRNGLISTDRMGQLEMYQHGISTLMLCEAVGMMPDRRDAKRLRDKLVLAVEVILQAQVRTTEDRGGWRYTMRSDNSDISVTGWQIMALRAAKNVGCDIPIEHIDQAIGYIKRCRDPQTGGYRYQRSAFVPTLPCTGTSMLALSLMEKDYTKSDEAYKAASYLLRNPLSPRQPHFYYGIYYSSQAMFQVGEKSGETNYWNSYRKTLHDLLLRQNPPRAAGYWDGFGSDDSQVGPNYCTAMAILALTVEYRFLPIYQRGEEPAEREKP
jgi:hypothetical protein